MKYTLLNNDDKTLMLKKIGVSKIDDLFADLPQDILLDKLDGLPEPVSEMEIFDILKSESCKNSTKRMFLGAGSYNHYIPAVVDDLASRSEFYTAYTPYQPEVSQGTLTAIFEFQTYMCRLTGMDVTNASMYDGATSLAEAVMMSARNSRKDKVLVSRAVNPLYREVLATYAWAAGLIVEEIPLKGLVTDFDAVKKLCDDETGAVVIQSPNFFGCIEDPDASSSGFSAFKKEKKLDLIYTVTEALSLGFLKSPAETGADIVCGEAQSFGSPVSFGGPMLGFISAKEHFTRKIPGRLVGLTVDSDGNKVFALTLQAREQHIRREKATSNICSNEGILAVKAAVYLGTTGPRLGMLGKLNHNTASYLRENLLSAGFSPVSDDPFFNEFVLHNGKSGFDSASAGAGFDLGEYYPELRDCTLFCATETDTMQSIDNFIEKIKSGSVWK
ncbi:MAG: aminomethyl-transferring glycine dehydrogenase subunit GcvPA [Spirochaetales bacterium]|nr:aminomethyl-transferring glycine dehydrogenase subunit GcvPA [Spirochaetales bacterium]